MISELTSAFAELQLGAGIGLQRSEGLDNYASLAELKPSFARWMNAVIGGESLVKDLNLYHDASGILRRRGIRVSPPGVPHCRA